MKRYLLFFILLVSLGLLSSSSCKKTAAPASDNSYGLPNVTQTGANTMGCLINDTDWIVNTNAFNLQTSFHGSNNRDTLSIAGSANSALIYTIIFVINSQIQEGVTYRLNDTTKACAFCASIRNIIPLWYYATDGYITITKFSGTYTVPACCSYGGHDANAIISGTFNFFIVLPNCDTIKVTNGRFDINYSQY